MTRDNNILGVIRLHDIPKKLMWEEKIEVIFDLDADGILNILSTVKSTGNKEDIKVDAKTSGRLTSEEINKMIGEADEMKHFDQQEENRVHSRNSLEAMCMDIEFNAKLNQCPESLREKAKNCLSWIKGNMDVDEESFASKRAEILKEIEILDHKFNQQKPPRSNTSQDFLK